MRVEALGRISSVSPDIPDRFRTVLETALLDRDDLSEAVLLLESALAVHRNPPGGLLPAEAVLAGDAFVPMAVQAMLERGMPIREIDSLLEEFIQELD